MKYYNTLILLALAVMSILLSTLLSFFLPNLPILIFISSTSLIFLGLFFLFDYFLWRFMAGIPDISGSWLGNLSTSRSENSLVEPVQVRIVQRWFTTRVDFIGKFSSSSSLAAVCLKDSNGQATLAYIYRTTPNEGDEKEVPPHIGICILRLVDSQRLSGFYHYMGSGEEESRFIHGQLVLTRP